MDGTGDFLSFAQRIPRPLSDPTRHGLYDVHEFQGPIQTGEHLLSCHSHSR